jgi:hypothetical protein
MISVCKIPPTDEYCFWDWRSVRCEPACECHLQPMLWDYHLGRSCRYRRQIDASCQPVDPASVFRDQPVVQRVRSLVVQTAQILKDRVIQTVVESIATWQSFRQNLCVDVWTPVQPHLIPDLYQERLNSEMATVRATALKSTTLATDQLECYPPGESPSLLIAQRLFCRPIQFLRCFATLATESVLTSDSHPHLHQKSSLQRKRTTKSTTMGNNQHDVLVNAGDVGFATTSPRRNVAKSLMRD